MGRLREMCPPLNLFILFVDVLGKTSLFILCERMSITRYEDYPDCIKLIKLMLSHYKKNLISYNPDPEISLSNILESNKLGETILDIKNKSGYDISCYDQVIEIIKSSAMTISVHNRKYSSRVISK
jgi:hypothetical protein